MMPTLFTSDNSKHQKQNFESLDQGGTYANQNDEHSLHTSNSSSPNNRLAPFNPTSVVAQELALKLFRFQSNDILFDLGCGDARFLIYAAESLSLNDVNESDNIENGSVDGRSENRHGLRCVGVEYDTLLVTRAHSMIEKKCLSNSVHVRLGDVMDMHTDINNLQSQEVKCDKTIESLVLTDATAVFLYLLPSGLHAIKNLLENVADQKYRQKRKMKDSLPKGNEEEYGNDSIVFRVVSYMFSIPGWTPTEEIKTPKTGCSLYLYDLGGKLDS